MNAQQTNKVRAQYLRFVDLRRKYKFSSNPADRLVLQGKLVNLQVYSDMALILNKELTEDEKELLKAMGKINIGRPND